MNDIIFAIIIALIFYALGIFMGIACYIKLKKKNPVATLFVSKIPNDGFYSVGVKICCPYEELIKNRYGLTEISIVEDVRKPEGEE